MTSEIVVMNRLGIALATDSAATVMNAGRAKVFHADKLFMLSKRQPVGVMTYNSSSLLGVPWETIIKMYRRQFDQAENVFDTLEEYAKDFLGYLDNNEGLFPTDVQQRYLQELVQDFFEGIRDKIDLDNWETFRYSGKESAAANNKAAKRIILETFTLWNGKQDVNCFDPAIGSHLISELSDKIVKLIGDNFAIWQIDAEAQNALTQLAMFVVSKEKILHESLSGIVIAGFGAKQHFPVMQAFELGEIYKGRLKYRHVETERIDTAQSSVVKPFADNEMVDTFLNGISPAFERRLRRDITKLFEALPGVVIDGLSGISTKRKKAYTSKAIPIIEDVVIKPLLARIERYKKEKKLLPIQQAISFLPKNELAHVAATLVSLNSFQKRMSLGEDETVGGPIDKTGWHDPITTPAWSAF